MGRDSIQWEQPTTRKDTRGGARPPDNAHISASPKNQNKQRFLSHHPMKTHPFLRRSWLSLTRAVLATGVAVVLGAPLVAVAAQEPEPIPVANFTPYNDLPGFIQTNLSDELKAEIRSRKLAVFVISATFPSLKTCYVTMGLTHAAAEGQSPRWPSYLVNASSVEAENWDENTCASERVKATLESMNGVPLVKLLTDIERTRADGFHLRKKARQDMVRLTANDLDSANEEKVFSILQRVELGKAIDYRHAQTFVVGRSAEYGDGKVLCVAFAGLTARAPEGRAPRVPRSYESFARTQKGGSVQGCYSDVVPQAVEALVNRPWDAQGLLAQFDVTREEGIPLPNAKQARRVQTALLKAQDARPAKQQLVRTTSVNRVTCSNQCVNGNCLRTFPNGRKERWEAPRVFNPMTQNWDWDTQTNGCGG